MPEKTRISVGGCKRFECQVIGYPRPTIQWFKDGDNITNNKRYQFDYCEEGVITMTIEDVTHKDQGCYQCRADNCVGWAATAAYLHIRGAKENKDDELISVHKMKFETGGSHGDKDEPDDALSRERKILQLRYHDFIDSIDSVESDKISEDINTTEELNNSGKKMAFPNKTNDSGIGQEDDLQSLSSSIDVLGERDTKQHSLRTGRYDSVDVESLEDNLDGFDNLTVADRNSVQTGDFDIHTAMKNTSVMSATDIANIDDSSKRPDFDTNVTTSSKTSDQHEPDFDTNVTTASKTSDQLEPNFDTNVTTSSKTSDRSVANIDYESTLENSDKKSDKPVYTEIDSVAKIDYVPESQAPNARHTETDSPVTTSSKTSDQHEPDFDTNVTTSSKPSDQLEPDFDTTVTTSTKTSDQLEPDFETNLTTSTKTSDQSNENIEYESTTENSDKNPDNSADTEIDSAAKNERSDTYEQNKDNVPEGLAPNSRNIETDSPVTTSSNTSDQPAANIEYKSTLENSDKRSDNSADVDDVPEILAPNARNTETDSLVENERPDTHKLNTDDVLKTLATNSNKTKQTDNKNEESADTDVDSQSRNILCSESDFTNADDISNSVAPKIESNPEIIVQEVNQSTEETEIQESIHECLTDQLLKADDKGRLRRLTGDSGIAEDESGGSSCDSEEEIQNQYTRDESNNDGKSTQNDIKNIDDIKESYTDSSSKLNDSSDIDSNMPDDKKSNRDDAEQTKRIVEDSDSQPNRINANDNMSNDRQQSHQRDIQNDSKLDQSIYENNSVTVESDTDQTNLGISSSSTVEEPSSWNAVTNTENKKYPDEFENIVVDDVGTSNKRNLPDLVIETVSNDDEDSSTQNSPKNEPNDTEGSSMSLFDKAGPMEELALFECLHDKLETKQKDRLSISPPHHFSNAGADDSEGSGSDMEYTESEISFDERKWDLYTLSSMESLNMQYLIDKKDHHRFKRKVSHDDYDGDMSGDFSDGFDDIISRNSSLLFVPDKQDNSLQKKGFRPQSDVMDSIEDVSYEHDNDNIKRNLKYSPEIFTESESDISSDSVDSNSDDQNINISVTDGNVSSGIPYGVSADSEIDNSVSSPNTDAKISSEIDNQSNELSQNVEPKSKSVDSFEPDCEESNRTKGPTPTENFEKTIHKDSRKQQQKPGFQRQSAVENIDGRDEHEELMFRDVELPDEEVPITVENTYREPKPRLVQQLSINGKELTITEDPEAAEPNATDDDGLIKNAAQIAMELETLDDQLYNQYLTCDTESDLSLNRLKDTNVEIPNTVFTKGTSKIANKTDEPESRTNEMKLQEEVDVDITRPKEALRTLPSNEEYNFPKPMSNDLLETHADLVDDEKKIYITDELDLNVAENLDKGKYDQVLKQTNKNDNTPSMTNELYNTDTKTLAVCENEIKSETTELAKVVESENFDIKQQTRMPDDSFVTGEVFDHNLAQQLQNENVLKTNPKVLSDEEKEKSMINELPCKVDEQIIIDGSKVALKDLPDGKIFTEKTNVTSGEEICKLESKADSERPLSRSVEQAEDIVKFESKTRNIEDAKPSVRTIEQNNSKSDQQNVMQYDDKTQSPCFTKEVTTADEQLQYRTKNIDAPNEFKLKGTEQDDNVTVDGSKGKRPLSRTNELPVDADNGMSTLNDDVNETPLEVKETSTAVPTETISKVKVKPSERIVELQDGKQEGLCPATEESEDTNGDFSLKVELQTNAGEEYRPPRILNATSDVTVHEGETLTVQWEVTGFPEPKVNIYKDEEDVQDFEWVQLYKDGNKYTMKIDHSQKEDTGYYIIHVSNDAGSDTIEACAVVKNKVSDVPLNEREAIVERPPEFVVAPSKCKVKEGEPAVIQTKVTGTPQPVVEWLKDDKPLEESDDISIYVDDGYQYLTVNRIHLSDGGEYTCRAKNELGVNQIDFTVDVEERKENDDDGQTPTCPFVQLEVSESYEFMPKKYLVAANYEDTNNDVSLQQGEIIELLDKTLQSYWLVRDLKERQRICYVPSALLQPIQEGDEFDDIGINGRQAVVSEEQKKIAEERKRHSIADLVESETDYICDMKDLMENYYDALEEKFPDMMVDENKDIYQNLTDLYSFHKKELLPELIASTENPAKVANLFLEKKDKFVKYIPLCAGKDKVDNFLGSEEVRQFLQAYSQALGDPDTAFTDLLNRPVDRIHEYIELLKSLIKYTALAGGDCTQLISAVQMLTDLCREVENLMLLDRVQGYDGDVKDLGPVIRHEKVTLWKEDEVSVPEGERHIFLFPDKIMVTKILKPAATPSDLPELKFENVIDLKDVEINEYVQEDTKRVELWDRYIEESDLLNELTSPSITLQASNIYDKQAWVRDIKEAQQKLGVESTLKDKMPERRKIKTKTPKMVTSTPKKKDKHGGHMDNESDRSSDDFKIIDTSRDVNVSYTTPEFEDGTTRPMFKKKLQKTYVEENSTVRLECVVAGIPLPKVLWLKNNRPLKDSDNCNVIVDGDTNILEFQNAERDDTGLYTARAMNANGSTISTAELYVGDVQPSALTKYKEGLIESEFKTPAYFFQMNSCQVEEGRLARFDCRVVAYPRPDIVWMKDGKIVDPGDRHKLLNFNNEIYSLLIQNVELIDKGRYTCWAHNKYGEAMTEAYLNVIALEDRVEDEDIAPKFLTKFYDQTITDGLPAEFQCLIDGRPQPVVRWLLNDIEIHPSPDIMVYSENNLCALRIKEVKQKDGGKYQCHIANNLGEASCVANLSVVDKKIKGVPVLPKFLKKIGDMDLKTGEDHTFEVVVVGEPAPKVTWLYNHKPISPTHRRFLTSQEGDIYRLTIKDIQFEDDGKFTCKAVNSEGEVYCSGNVKVTKARKVPDESEQLKFKQTDFDAKYGCAPSFMKKLEDVSAPEGNDAKFECRVMGIPEPEVIWTKDGKAIRSDGHYLVTQDGSGHCILHIKNVQPRDKGVYTCTVSNAAGQTACTGQLRLGTPKESLDRESTFQPTRRLSRESISKLQAIPTMPHEKPTILDVRPDSARLSWIPVSTIQLPPEAKNITYVIEAKELPHGYDWKKMASGIHGHTHLVKNLRPDIEYAFRVKAENQFGISDASPQVLMERQKPEIVQEEKAQKLRFKLPESKKPPKLPTTRPVITEMGEESVRLAWKPAVTLPTAKKALPVSYRLEAQELPGTDWLPFASRISDISHYLPELSQDRDYNIRVRAENKYGLSEPTEPLWIPRATAYPGIPISRPEIVEIEPEAVRLNWQRVEVPATGLDESPLMYMIEMQKPPSQTWKEIARDIAGTTYLVKDLHPGQDYRFRVRARTPVGKMLEPSPAISLYRTLASSRVPIDRFELDEYEPDYEGIRLKWAQVKVPPYHLDEEPLLYMIEGQEQPLDEWRPLVSGIPTTHYRITDLVPDRDYRFRVRALSQHGVSPPTHALPVSYRRQLPAPSRPLTLDHPRLMYDETEALQLAWQPPAIDTKRPIKYKIELQAPPSLEWRPLASGVPDTKYRIQGLGPSRDYMFRVIPETTLGPLEALPPVSLTTLAAPRTTLPSRPKIHDLQPESLNLSWQRPMLEMHKPLKYRIDVQEAPRLDWQPVAYDVPDTSYRVTGLRPQRDYMFRVVPMTTAGAMEPLPPVSVTSMPVRPRLSQREPRITELSKDSVKLTWQPADIPMYLRHETPVHYIVDMRTLPGQDWKPVARRVKDTSYVVKNLRPDKEYQFRIKAETDAGVSEPTYPVTIYRKPVPIFPRREPVITGVSQDSVALSWLPADIAAGSGRAPVIQYRIETQYPPGIGPWEPIVSNIQRTSYHVTGLHPDGDYMFRVRAVADGIVSEPTQPVYLTRRAAPPRMPPEQPYIFDMHPDNLKLQWRAVELPSRITDYSPITYRVEFQEGPRSDWMTLARGIPHTDFNVMSLDPEKEYKFRVRAENTYGIGDPTPVVSVPRRAVAPTMPQEEPLLYDLGPHSVNLRWRPAEIPSYLNDGSPITYTIYALEPPGTSWQPIVRRIPHNFYHLANIRPEQEYHFRIQAENRYGVSRPTLPVKLPKMADLRLPVEITDISDIDDKSASLSLHWQPRHLPQFDKVPVKYQVEAWEPRKHTWKRLASAVPDTSFRVTGLAPEDDYMFRVRAEAASLLSEPTYPISLSRFRLPSGLPPLRPQLHDLQPESVRLSWHPLHVPSYQGTRNLFPRYIVEMKEMLGKQWKPVGGNVLETTYRVGGLDGNRDYEFRVRGVGDRGLSEPSIPVMLHRRTVLPRIPLSRPEVVRVEDDAINLRWNVVDVPAIRHSDAPLSFMIEQQTLPKYDWSPIARGVSDTNFRITGLKQNQDYAFRIRGEFTSGLSEPSPYVPVYRRPIKPGVPIARPEIWEDEPYKARLRWQKVYIPPYDQFDDLTYRIEIQHPPNRDWRPLVSGIKMTEHEVTDLSPKKDYLFRIRAESPNGDISDPTPPIAYYRSQLPMARESFKIPEYKHIEVDFTGPNRSYIDHLTTYIPPRLPVEKPELFQLGPEKVTLSWKPARVSDRIRGTSKVTYSVEVRTPPSFEWRVLASDLTSCVTDLNSLHPELDYIFRVRAYNEYGASEPTLPVSLYRPIELEDDNEFFSDEDLEPITIGLGEYETTIDEAPPKLPMDTPKIIDQGETAYLSWLAARIPVYAKKTPITYSVEIKEPNVPGWSHFASGVTATEFFIEGLKSNADYQFRVKAETQFGCSEPTLPVSLNRSTKKDIEENGEVEVKEAKRPSMEMKNEDFQVPLTNLSNIPSGAPPRIPSSRPLITNNFGTSLNLSWMPGRVPTYVKDYKMKYVLEVREPPSEKWRTLADNLMDNTYDVKNLLPDQDYMFRVRAKNEYGASEPTLPVAVIRQRDDYVPPVLSRQNSRDSGSPWIRSRASSIESIPKQKYDFLDDTDDDIYPKKASAPEFKSPDDANIQYGVVEKSAKLCLKLRGSPLPNITWQFNGEPLELGDKVRGFISPNGTVTLEFKRMKAKDAGQYKCVAENEHGIAVRIVQLEEADPPMFLDPLKDLVIDSRGRGRLECRVDGIPYPTVKWMKDSKSLGESSRLKFHHEEPDYWSLTLESAIMMDSGHYTCVAENHAGQAVSSCRINIAEHKLPEREPTYRDLYFREANLEDFYYILEELGRGRHGIVRRVVDKVSGKQFAAKMVHVCEAPQKHFFRHELETMRLLSHKNVPTIADAFQTDRRLAVVMELVPGGELLDRIVANDNWTESEAAFFVKQLLTVVRHMQKAGVAHLDLKPSNIHLAGRDSDEIKLLDFGLSRILYKDFDVKLNYGTPGFTSPEQINNDPLTSAADMWNVGAVTYFLLSGQCPFTGNSDKETLTNIQTCDWKFDDKAFDGISKQAKDFISKLLIYEPSERISVEECLQHPWIKSFTSRGQGVKINLDKMKTFHSEDKKKRRANAVVTNAKVDSLTYILKPDNPVQGLEPQKNETGEIVFPDSSSYGEYLDEESWYDWQNRYHQGPETRLDALVESEVSVPMRSYLHGDDDEDLMDDLLTDPDAELETVSKVHPQVQKECEWRELDADMKYKLPPSNYLDSLTGDSEKKVENPVFVVKLQDVAYNSGENVTLSCQVLSETTPVVTWFRNEELITDGNRIKTSFTEDSSVYTMTLVSAKPYDAGVYKCIARNKSGRAFTAARVLHGDAPGQSSRPAVTAVSSTEALLVWEPPTTDGNSPVTGYRIDYRKSGDERWNIYGTVIDECTVVSSLEPNTSYRFRIVCVNNIGMSSYSVASTEIKTKPQGTPNLVLDKNVQSVIARQKLIEELPTMPSDRISSALPITSKFATLQEEPCDKTYSLLNSLSVGKFSELRLCRNNSTNELYTVKIVPFTPDNKSDKLREHDILRTLNHEGITQLQNSFVDNNKLYFVLDNLSGVNILQHFSYKTKYSEEMVTIVIRQLLGAIQYLQYEGIVHLNLQPSSVVMVNRNSLQLKITNFELAQKLEGHGRVMPRAGYPDFVAPEVVAQEKTSYSADVWTVGTLAFLLLSGESPFGGRTEEETFANVAYCRYDAHSIYENVTKEALKFIFKVLKRIPRNRLSPDDCLDDKWLQLSEIKVKSQREAIFTTPKLRVYAEIYQERCRTGVYTITPVETKPATILEDKPVDLPKPKADSQKDKDIKAPSVGKLSVKPPEPKTSDVSPKTSQPKVKPDEVQKKKTEPSTEKVKDNNIKGGMLNGEKFIENNKAADKTFEKQSDVKKQDTVAPKSDKTQQEPKPEKLAAPVPPVTQPKKDEALPATKPVEPKKDEPLPVTKPVETKKDEPLAATKPVEPKKDEPLPATKPVETKKDEPLPVTKPVETKKDEPLLSTKPVEPKKNEPLPSTKPVESKKDEPLPVTKPVEAKKKEPLPATKPVEPKKDEPAPATKPVESKKDEPLADTKPVEPKKDEPPSATKPVEPKKDEPAPATKPVESKKDEPLADTKPVEPKKDEPLPATKPVEPKKDEPAPATKPVESKKDEPLADTKPVEPKKDEPLPATKPVEPKKDEPAPATKPVESKKDEPLADTKPVEPKKDEPLPATKPVEPKKDEPAPATKPVEPKKDEPLPLSETEKSVTKEGEVDDADNLEDDLEFEDAIQENLAETTEETEDADNIEDDQFDDAVQDIEEKDYSKEKEPKGEKEGKGDKIDKIATDLVTKAMDEALKSSSS